MIEVQIYYRVSGELFIPNITQLQQLLEVGKVARCLDIVLKTFQKRQIKYPADIHIAKAFQSDWIEILSVTQEQGKIRQFNIDIIESDDALIVQGKIQPSFVLWEAVIKFWLKGNSSLSLI